LPVVMAGSGQSIIIIIMGGFVMKKLLNELIGKEVLIHLKSGEILGYQLIIDVFENTLVTSYGNTVRLIEIGHIGEVVAYYHSRMASQDDIRSALGIMNNNSNNNDNDDNNKNNKDNKNDNKDNKKKNNK
jgi:hypothetical protein